MKLSRLFALLGALVFSTAVAQAADVKKISPADAAKLVQEKKAVLVDCREPNEWAATGVAAPAVLLPKSDFDGDRKQWNQFLEKNRGKQIIVYCRSGRRSGAVAEALAKEGVTTANAGGLEDWTKAGLPTRKVEPSRIPSDKNR